MQRWRPPGFNLSVIRHRCPSLSLKSWGYNMELCYRFIYFFWYPSTLSRTALCPFKQCLQLTALSVVTFKLTHCGVCSACFCQHLDRLVNHVWVCVWVCVGGNITISFQWQMFKGLKKQNAQRYPEGTIKCPVRVTTVCTKPEWTWDFFWGTLGPRAASVIWLHQVYFV